MSVLTRYMSGSSLSMRLMVLTDFSPMDFCVLLSCLIPTSDYSSQHQLTPATRSWSPAQLRAGATSLHGLFRWKEGSHRVPFFARGSGQWSFAPICQRRDESGVRMTSLFANGVELTQVWLVHQAARHGYTLGKRGILGYLAVSPLWHSM